MAEPRRHLIPLRAVWLLLVCTAFPAGSAVAAESSANTKELVFTVLATGAKPLPEGLHYLESPDEGVALKASFARRTEVLPAATGKTLVFGVPRANPAPGESRFVALCSVPWPAEVSERALVLLATGESGRVSGVVIDDGERAFPHGTVRVVNLVKRPLAARWGDNTWEISPGPGVARPYPVMAASGAGQAASRFKVMLGTLREDGVGSTLIYAGRAEARPGARTLVVVREVRETEVTNEGEVMNAGVSYNVRWVVDSLPQADKPAP